MNDYEQEALEKSILQELDSLTATDKIKWKIADQEYTAIHNGMSYSIVDSGQNWLVIKKEIGGEPVHTIMDTEGATGVQQLLNTIKHYSLGPARSYYFDSLLCRSDLEEVLKTLKKRGA